MMVTMGIYARRGKRMLRRWMLEPRVHVALQSAAYFLAGLLLSAASLGSRPLPLTLGLLCATTGWSSLLLASGGMSGYLLFWGSFGGQPVLWLMVGLLLVLTVGERQLVRGSLLLMPSLAGLVTAATGLAFLLWQGDSTPVELYLLRVGLAILSGAVFRIGLDRRDPLVDWAIAGFAVLALAQVAPIPWLDLGYIAAGALCCIGAFPAAALAGLALDLAQITAVPMTAVLSLAFVLRLLPWKGKWLLYAAPLAAYFLVMQLSGLWDLTPLPALALGGLVSALLPAKAALAQRRGETGVAQVRLEMASAVLDQTGELLHILRQSPIDEQALMVRAAERACSSCPFRNKCRENPREMSTEWLHKPLGNGADLPLNCRKSGRLLQELRRSQEQLRTIRADRDRQREYRAAVIQLSVPVSAGSVRLPCPAAQSAPSVVSAGGGGMLRQSGKGQRGSVSVVCRCGMPVLHLALRRYGNRGGGRPGCPGHRSNAPKAPQCGLPTGTCLAQRQQPLRPSGQSRCGDGGSGGAAAGYGKSRGLQVGRSPVLSYQPRRAHKDRDSHPTSRIVCGGRAGNGGEAVPSEGGNAGTPQRRRRWRRDPAPGLGAHRRASWGTGCPDLSLVRGGWLGRCHRGGGSSGSCGCTGIIP